VKSQSNAVVIHRQSSALHVVLCGVFMYFIDWFQQLAQSKHFLFTFFLLI